MRLSRICCAELSLQVPQSVAATLDNQGMTFMEEAVNNIACLDFVADEYLVPVENQTFAGDEEGSFLPAIAGCRGR